jgi:hypothetical protein
MSIYVPAESKGTLWEEVGAGRNIHLGQFREVAELCWEGTPKQTIVTVPATFDRKLKNINYPLQFYTDNWASDYSWFSWNYDLIASFAHITQNFRHELWARNCHPLSNMTHVEYQLQVDAVSRESYFHFFPNDVHDNRRQNPMKESKIYQLL